MEPGEFEDVEGTVGDEGLAFKGRLTATKHGFELTGRTSGATIARENCFSVVDGEGIRHVGNIVDLHRTKHLTRLTLRVRRLHSQGPVAKDGASGRPMLRAWLSPSPLIHALGTAPVPPMRDLLDFGVSPDEVREALRSRKERLSWDFDGFTMSFVREGVWASGPGPRGFLRRTLTERPVAVLRAVEARSWSAAELVDFRKRMYGTLYAAAQVVGFLQALPVSITDREFSMRDEGASRPTFHHWERWASRTGTPILRDASYADLRARQQGQIIRALPTAVAAYEREAESLFAAMGFADRARQEDNYKTRFLTVTTGLETMVKALHRRRGGAKPTFKQGLSNLAGEAGVDLADWFVDDGTRFTRFRNKLIHEGLVLDRDYQELVNLTLCGAAFLEALICARLGLAHGDATMIGAPPHHLRRR